MKEALTPQVKVSVVMCTYNGEKYLREQIESILNQTCPVYELIIQDDRSTDRTVEIVREYQQKDSRVKLFVNEQSLGFNYNFSTAFTGLQENTLPRPTRMTFGVPTRLRY